MQAHFKDELWGLSCHPTVCHVATAGDEGTVRVWDTLARNVVHMRVRGSWLTEEERVSLARSRCL